VVNATLRSLYSREIDPVPLYRRAGGHQSRSERVRKISTQQGFDPQSFQPVANLYTDCNFPAHCIEKNFFYQGATAPKRLGLLIIEASRSHSEAPQSVGLLWTSDQPVTETSTSQHTTLLTRDRHPCCRRDSKPQSQHASSRRPTP